MKLPYPKKSLEQQLLEFDLWITPSIQEIQDTEKYDQELDRVSSLIRSIGPATNNFSSVEYCTPQSISNTCVDLIEESISSLESIDNKMALAKDIVESLISLLFMVTGKTDNNMKCQFPVYLAQSIGRTDFPQKKSRKGNIEFENLPLGRTFRSSQLSKIISNALVYSAVDDDFLYLEEEAKWLLNKYVTILLKDKKDVKQLWALGNSYYNLLNISPGSEKELLAPIVIFKVRGSVSASGGHIPENMLRGMMEQWGMERGVDFNLDDVILTDSGDKRNTKTRAYDFVLPYTTKDWAPHIFVQCQFYAGDSGSVSHKVVDQTEASRSNTIEFYPRARFIEYLDGAGYFSSLNTDLQHMIGMKSTTNFIQIRTAHVKLRRELQLVGFLTLVEIEHAILRSEKGDISSVRTILCDEGYSLKEIDRTISNSVDRGLLQKEESSLLIREARLKFAMRLMIIDLVAITGHGIETTEGCSGNILIPGYANFFGSRICDISDEIDFYAPNVDYSRTDFAEDITWLAENRFIIIK